MSWPVIERPRTALRYVQFDLLAVGAWVALVLAVLLGDVESVALRFVLGLPFLLFVPGYALVSALFPHADRSAESGDDRAAVTGPTDSPAGTTVDWGERVVLSFVSSVVLVPLVGFALNFTSFGVRLLPTVVCVSAVTLALTVAATYRRTRIPAEARFGTGMASALAGMLDGSRERRSLNAALNVLLVAGLLVVAASIVYAGMSFDDREPYTEFYVVEENATGERVAGDYPMNVTRGENRSVQLVIANHERERVNYTVVAVLVNASDDGTAGDGAAGSGSTARDGRTVARLDATVAPGESRRVTHVFEPAVVGDRLTLVYLLYRDRPPEQPSTESAYRSLYLQVNVSAAEANGSSGTGLVDGEAVARGSQPRTK